jgi:hypothetical protein
MNLNRIAYIGLWLGYVGLLVWAATLPEAGIGFVLSVLLLPSMGIAVAYGGIKLAHMGRRDKNTSLFIIGYLVMALGGLVFIGGGAVSVNIMAFNQAMQNCYATGKFTVDQCTELVYKIYYDSGSMLPHYP